MSRVGRKPIEIPEGLQVLVETDHVLIKGPKGQLKTLLPVGIRAKVVDRKLIAERAGDAKKMKALHGLGRSLLANAVEGVMTGFRKELDIVGIGYRAQLKGRFLSLSLGFSHTIEFPFPEGIEIQVERLAKTIQNYVATMVVSGIDKAKVGQVAADLRSLRPPDSYKGKGIRYAGEQLRLKVGKKGV